MGASAACAEAGVAVRRLCCEVVPAAAKVRVNVGAEANISVSDNRQESLKALSSSPSPVLTLVNKLTIILPGLPPFKARPIFLGAGSTPS